MQYKTLTQNEIDTIKLRWKSNPHGVNLTYEEIEALLDTNEMVNDIADVITHACEDQFKIEKIEAILYSKQEG